MPMSEFGDQEEDAERPAPAGPAGRSVGELESIDNVLGDEAPRDRGDRPRGGRRRR
jgi:hypothetical protein